MTIDRRVELCLAQAVGPPQFDLTRQNIKLPHQASDVMRLLQPWLLTSLAFDSTGLELKPSTIEALQGSVPYEMLAPMAGRQAEMHIYTDGSWSEHHQRGGYALVLVLVLAGVSAVLGALGEQTQGNSDSVWDFQAPPALKNEQLAIAVAMLWLLQGCNFTNYAGIKLHYDCLPAGMAATGEWKPVNPFAERTHALESYIQAIAGISLQLQHVKAHADDPFNELADTLAKLVARHPDCLVPPPRDACANFLGSDWTWLAPVVRHGWSGVLPCGPGGDLVWSQSNPFAPPTIEPHQLIPVCAARTQGNGEALTFNMRVFALNAQGLAGVACFQETKEAAGVCVSRAFMRLGTRADMHFGTAVWISRQRGLLTSNGRACLVTEDDVRVVVNRPFW